MDWTHHGGQCCGIKHVYNLSNIMSAERIKEFSSQRVRQGYSEVVPSKNNTLSYIISDLGRSHGLIEIVATDYQLSGNHEIMKQLKENNFHLVSRFENPNSDNYCNVFHRYGTSGQDENELEGSPYLKFLEDV